jgi:imidazolonepropionase-like amidohydrolase
MISYLRPFVLLGILAGPVSAEVVAYKASRIWPGDGPAIDRGVLVIRDGKIASVGSEAAMEIPAEAKVMDLGSGVLIPGLVAAESGLGNVGIDDERTLTPEVRAIDGFNFFDDFQPALAGGVTTAQIGPGRDRLIPGRGAVVKLFGKSTANRTLREDEGLRVVLTGAALNPPLLYEPPAFLTSRDRPVQSSRAQPGRSLGGAVAALRSLLKSSRTYAAIPESERESDVTLEGLLPLAAEKPVLRIEANRASEVRAAIDLGREFGLTLLLVDPTDLRPFLDSLDSWKGQVRGVVLSPRVRPGRLSNPPLRLQGDPKPRTAWEDAAALLKAGLPVAIAPSADADLADLLFLGGLFTSAEEMSPERVLRMLTLTPAELLGVSDRVGSLSPGKDADFVVLSADPFDLHGQVREVYVAGERAFELVEKPKALVLRAGQIVTGSGTVIEHGAISIEGTTIRGLGEDVSAPPGAEIEDFEGCVITPGLIDLAADLGLGGPLSTTSPPTDPLPDQNQGAGGRFGGNEGQPNPQPSGFTGSISLDTKLGDRLVRNDPTVAFARTGGVTTVLTGPRGAGPGPLVAFKLGDDPTVLRDPVGIRFGMSGNVAAAVANLKRSLDQGKQYADSWTKYETDLAAYEAKRKEYDAAKAKYDADLKAAEAKKAEEAKKQQEATKKEEPAKEEPKKEEPKKEEPKAQEPAKDAAKPDAAVAEAPKPPEEPKAPQKPNETPALEPYRALFAGKIPALVDARRIDAIKAAVGLFRDEFKVRLILLNAEDAFRDPKLLSDKEVRVAVGPELVRSVERKPVNLPQVLASVAIPFGFQSEATTGVRDLPLAVKYAVRQGLGVSDGLRGLTSGPATMLGLDDRVGTLAVGKDADLVVWSGQPFALSSRVVAVMINGAWVYRAGDREEGQ